MVRSINDVLLRRGNEALSVHWFDEHIDFAATDPAYRGVYRGDPAARDRAYHQGTAWTWLLPHFALAYERVHGRREEALAFLRPLENLIGAYGVGSLPEITDGDLPHAARGAIAQAWSVAEVLRAFHTLSSEPRRVRRRPAARRAEVLARA